MRGFKRAGPKTWPREKSKWRTWCANLSVLAVPIGVLVFVWQTAPKAADSTTDATTSASTTPATTNPDPQFGVEPGWALTNLTPAQLQTRLAAAKALGVTWIRFDMEWSLVQPNNAATYDWADYDRVAAAIQASGLHALGIIDYTPGWAATAGCKNTPNTDCQPASSALFATFASAVAKRYAPKGLHDWEIWNEPNWPSFWEPSPNAIVYTQFLRAAYLAIHVQDPSATVMVGGLSATGDGGNAIAATTFLRDIYAAGGKGFFDAVAMHPYTFPRLPSDSARAGGWQELYTLHDIMQSYGDGAKKVWITEFGAPTNGPGVQADSPASRQPNGVDHESETQQATLLQDAVKQYETLPWAGPFFWYDLEDIGGARTFTSESYYGLLGADGTPKPAYAAYQKAIAGAK